MLNSYAHITLFSPRLSLKHECFCSENNSYSGYKNSNKLASVKVDGHCCRDVSCSVVKISNGLEYEYYKLKSLIINSKFLISLLLLSSSGTILDPLDASSNV